MRNIILAIVMFGGLLMGCMNGSRVQQEGIKAFSVSATRQVEFSPGNLDMDGHSFVAHQWDYGWLLGWGTGNRPADTTDDWHNYVKFVDWGDCVKDGWRTPTADEWHYLLFDRIGANEKRSVGTVNDMHGLLLLPDEWVLPSGCAFVSQAIDWEINSYSISEWQQMENAGAVFLPAAGFRWGGMPYGFNCEGLYWSSSTQSEGCPYTMHFDDKILAVDWDNTPQFGQSVRLVRDCK